MAARMRRVLAFLVLAVALVALPAANRAAAAPCAAAGPMDCCAGMGDDAAPPCPCSWSAVPPTPAAVDAPQAPAVVLAEEPLPDVAVAADAAEAAPAPPVAPRARSAPLFLLLSVLLV